MWKVPVVLSHYSGHLQRQPQTSFPNRSRGNQILLVSRTSSGCNDQQLEIKAVSLLFADVPMPLESSGDRLGKQVGWSHCFTPKMRQLGFPHGLKQMQEPLFERVVPGQVWRCGNGAKAEVIKVIMSRMLGANSGTFRESWRRPEGAEGLGLQCLFIPHTHQENLRYPPTSPGCDQTTCWITHQKISAVLWNVHCDVSLHHCGRYMEVHCSEHPVPLCDAA